MHDVRALSLAFTMFAAPAFAQHPAAEAPETTAVYRVAELLSPALLATLEREFDVLGTAPDSEGAELLVAVLSDDEARRLLAVAPGAELVDRGRPFAARAGTEIVDSGYYTTAEIVQEMDALVALAPSIAQRVDLSTFPGAGLTHEGQAIHALKISDNVAQDEDERAVVIAAQHHARELNTTHVVIEAMRRIVQGYATDPELQALVDSTEIWLVPCVNPDGVDRVWNADEYWRKNRRDNGDGTRGVDLNRNYETLWGVCGASTRTDSNIYRGPSAASEPEVRTMGALIEAVRPEVYIDLHSYGREVLFPYAPCSTFTPAIQGLLDHYVDDLRAPMSYDRRPATASGEAPEDHWNRGGTLSFLIEIGASFQPPFQDTVAEEVRVWPGLRRALTAWRPAVRGHVRSIFRSEPVAAEITFAPGAFAEGEVTRSRARDGRYGLWLPLGTWQVTWSAPGFVSATRTVTVSSLDTPQTLDIHLEPAWAPATLVKNGSERIGETTRFTYASPGDAGLVYWLPLSLGTTPGIPTGGRTIPLQDDVLLVTSLSAGPLFVNNLGALPPSESVVADLNIPNLLELAGLSLFVGGITFEDGYPDGVKRWADPVPVTLRP